VTVSDRQDVLCPSPGGIVGVIGRTAPGKTTLFRMITGQEKPDSGTIRIAETVKLAYVDQSRDILDPNKTIWEMISEGKDTIVLGTREINSRPMSPVSTFPGRTSRRGSTRSPAASGTESIWRGCSRRGRTSFSLTSRPTTST